MPASLLARFASLLLVVALLLPSLGAMATADPVRPRFNKNGVKRPVYKTYKPGHRWLFSQR
ncbi:hypothetical protein GCM10027048_43900 [Hymenobacter coalescens]